ncbi:MAG TPA: hypothetical protein VNQ79_18625 [Blastocatellia bacterium]|nr:hypothetical protein [Blastocatellia bacterium]
MNVSTLTISREEAGRKLDEYKSVLSKLRTDEDEKLQSLYAAVAKGARVLNLAGAFKEAGLNEQCQPRLAIARADWREVFCHRNPPLPDWRHTSSTAGFNDKARWNHQATARNLLLPDDTFVWPAATKWRRLSSPVPHIPPSVRPRFSLENYHNWQEYPVDPFLLRRIDGMLFVVEAEWELTELEAALLASMRQGN